MFNPIIWALSAFYTTTLQTVNVLLTYGGDLLGSNRKLAFKLSRNLMQELLDGGLTEFSASRVPHGYGLVDEKNRRYRRKLK